MPDPSLPTVLIVHGDRSTAGTYAEWLSTGYRTRVAPAAAPVDAPDQVDVVILDWGVEPPVREAVLEADDGPLAEAAVLAVDEGVPATDPIDAGADDYLLSPLGEGQLRAAVERAYLQRAYRKWVDEYVDATSDVDEGEFPPELPPPVEDAQEAMDLTLSELVEEVAYSTLFRALLERREED